MAKKKHAKKDEFIKGYACAAATLVWGWGEQSLAQHLIGEGGFDLDDMIKAGVEQSDIDKIYPTPEQEPERD